MFAVVAFDPRREAGLEGVLRDTDCGEAACRGFADIIATGGVDSVLETRFRAGVAVVNDMMRSLAGGEFPFGGVSP